LRDNVTSERFPFIEAKRIQRAGVICHRHADPDAYMAAFALTRLLQKLSPSSKVDVILPDGLSLLTRRLSGTFKQENLVEGQGDDTEYDLLVAVDIGHTELLKEWLEKLRRSKAVKVLIDHHPMQEDSPYDHLLVDPASSSASEVVASLFRDLDVPMDAQTAQALLLGILFDSQHLLIAKERTLREVVRLLDKGARIEDARSLLRTPPDYGEVIAKLKSARRLKLYKLGTWVAVTTTVGSFQSNVARSLISMGADVAVVSGETSGETRGSLRANQRFWEATKIHLGTDVAATVPGGTGVGGGHPTAASFTCSLDEDRAAEAALDKLASLLKVKPTEIR
jgi:phosphoesterase RecJ-like protein